MANQKKMVEEFISQKDTVSWNTEDLPAEYINIADMTASLSLQFVSMRVGCIFGKFKNWISKVT